MRAISAPRQYESCLPIIVLAREAALSEDHMFGSRQQRHWREPGTGGRKYEILGGAPWERVTAVVGQSMVLQDLYPQRYLVQSFPSDEQLKAMRLEMPPEAPNATG